MDSRIAVLPPHVIDQIAAGEVIERPASVVKELIDNAIDAGARTITIETAGGGRSLVRVVDDGMGMSAKDAVLAFERHATSKIRAVDDLWGLHTMGFRGEALPSIASVSRLTLTTRREADLAATRVIFEGGRLISVGEAGAPAGTTVEVADLLYNIPARLKFLKGDATEASHVTDLVAKIALAYPKLHLKLRHGGRTALEVPPERDDLARARSLLGVRVAQRLVAADGEEAGIRVTAFLAAPELAQTTSRGVQIFVGRRPVRDRNVLHAITMGYGELVPRGRYPVAVVLVDVPAGQVDVNVHPQKLEVRFAEPAAVAAAVRHVVQAGVASAPWRAESGAGPVQMIASLVPPALPFDGAATPLAQRYARDLDRARDTSQAGFAFAETMPATSAPRFVRAPSAARAWASEIQQQTRAARAAERRMELRETLEQPSPIAKPPFATFDVRGDTPPALAEGSGPAANAPAAAPGYFANLRYLGQLDLTYLVCESDGELVLVDQHAAHERVELDRLRAQHTDHAVAVQKLLFPTTLDATPRQLELVGRLGDLLATVGFECEAFGAATLAIKAVPAGIRHGDPSQLLRRLLDAWARDGTPSEAEQIDRVLSEIACHSVVRSGDRLTPDEAEALLRSVDGIDVTTPPPHGRALLLRLPLSEIGRRFGR